MMHPTFCDWHRCDVFPGEPLGAHRGRPVVVDARHGLAVVVQLHQSADAPRPSVRLAANGGVVLLHIGRAEDLAEALRSLAEEARA